MTKNWTTIAVFIAVILGMAWVGIPILWGAPTTPAPEFGRAGAGAAPLAARAPLRIPVPPELPAEDGFDPVRAARLARRSARRGDGAPAVPKPAVRIFTDRASHTALANVLCTHFDCDLRKARHRDVIEHVLSGKAQIGFVTVEPSVNERRLGARDFVLGSIEPALVVARNNPWQLLRREEMQAILGGRMRTWPGSSIEIETAGPKPGDLSNLFSEILIPGDTLAIRRPFARDADALDWVRSAPHGLAVVHLASLSEDLAQHGSGVRRLHVDQVPLRREVSVVFRNEHDVGAAAVLAFCRSPRGRAALGRVLAVR